MNSYIVLQSTFKTLFKEGFLYSSHVPVSPSLSRLFRWLASGFLTFS